MKYNPKIVIAYFNSCGIPTPELEYRFCPGRKWRFDFAWPCLLVALEVQGGTWRRGGGAHRGTGAIRDMEKFSEAAALGWRILYVQPQNLCLMDTALLIKRTLIGPPTL